MTNLTEFSETSSNAIAKSVLSTAPRASREWIAGRTVTLLGHFFQPDMASIAFQQTVNDWVETLLDIPQQAIELAIKERLRMPDRARPIPGEIREMARKYLAFPLRSVAAENPFHSGKVQVSPERAAEIAAEVQGNAAKLFRTKRPSDLTYERIRRIVADVTGVTLMAIDSPRRTEPICVARFMIAHLMSVHTNLATGRLCELEDTDHRTIANRLERAQERIAEDPDFAMMVEECERRLAE